MNGLIFALALLALVAVIWFRELWINEKRSWSFAVARAGLAVRWTVALSSCAYFLWFPLVGPPGVGYRVVEVFAFVAAGVVAFWRMKPAGPAPTPIGSATGTIGAWLWLPFLPVAGLAASVAWNQSLNNPLGVWDAISIWNMRARFLNRSGADWPTAFDTAFVHTDYPLLVPATVDRWWGYVGGELMTVPLFLSFLMDGRVDHNRPGRWAELPPRWGPGGQGWVGGTVLLASPVYAFWVGSQYADVLLGFYFLATGIVLAVHDRAGRTNLLLAALAGSFAGFAAWTKNEGLMFLAVVILVRGVIALRAWDHRKAAREATGFALGLVPAALALGYLKIRLAPPNDLVATAGESSFTRMLDWERHIQIVTAFGDIFADLSSYGFLVLPLYALFVGRRPRPERLPGPAGAATTVVLMVIGYYLIYLTTPHDLSWHIGTSMGRLLVQLWPLAVFTFFLSLGTIDETARFQTPVASVPKDAATPAASA